MGNYTIFQMFENPRRGRQARNFTANVPKIIDLKSSSEQIFPENSQMIANDRRADCSHTFQRKCQMYTRVVLAGKSKQTTWRISRRKILLQFISSFSPKATTTSASKPKETSVLASKNIHEETRY